MDKFIREYFCNRLLVIELICFLIKFLMRWNIETNITKKLHFTKCNNVKCNSIFLIDPEESPGELGYLCPECSRKIATCHIVQCSSCKTVLNFIRASANEEKVVFTIDKCSHCVGTIEDEWEIEPLYQAESYI